MFCFASISYSQVNIDETEYVNLETERLEVHNYLDYQFDNIPIGRYALYEFLLNRKLNSTVLNDEEWTEYKLYFKNVLFTLIAGKKIFKTIKPDRITTYNSNYSVNHIMCVLAEQRSIPHYTLHLGSHHKYMSSQITIFKGLIPAVIKNSHPVWKHYMELPLSPTKIKRAAEHVSYLLEATSPWVYSIKSNGIPEVELRNQFGIRNDQKVLLVTMASADERFAAAIVDALPLYKEPLFKTQLDWIEFLIQFAKSEPSIFLIIRAHPREFPNKRESILSKQAQVLQTAFKNLPLNVAVNFPKDSISLHDLIKITDVGLNATSTAGLELLLFGVPVVIYDWDQLFSYGRELNLFGATENEYKEQIYKAISVGPSLENVIKAYRWLSYNSDIVAIDISDGYNDNPTLINRIYRKLMRMSKLRKNYLIRPVKPLKNQNLLALAIEKGLDSHLDDYDYNKLDNASVSEERKLIGQYLINFSKVISARKQDLIFMNRIKKMCKS